MVVHGRVQNGVVVLDEGFTLPEGAEVTVFPHSKVELRRGKGPHSTADIPPLDLGKMIKPLSSDDDILGEMLEDRKI